MDESKLIEMSKDIESLKTDVGRITSIMKLAVSKAPKHVQEKVKKLSARKHAEHKHATPHFEDLHLMSISRLKQRLASHDQNEQETFTKKQAETWKTQRALILKELQKAIKENRTKNVSN